ncbi:MAG: peptide ABC transporter substrate-binding protein [Streptococcaceae bacterium]|jgi:oligopeptide transport system substrate-binding protein|nr:peptide ABC transporter substrate-binding protein [Streptococcaceae bacterium]
MKTWKKLSLAGTALAAGLILAACSGGASSKNPQLAIPTDITTLDSGINTDTYSGIFIGNTQEGALRVDANGDTQPALAKSVTKSKDGLTYTITLRSGLKWSNGDPITAQDFVYAWQRNDAPATGSQYAYLLASVKNAAEINSGKIKDLSQLGIKADSDTKLTVTLAQPTPYFNFLLSEPVYFPLDQKFVEAKGKSYGTSSANTVYDGAFIFKGSGWTGSNESFSLVKNPNYYDKADVKSNEIDWTVQKNPQTAVNLFKQGKLDQASLGTPQLYAANKGYNGGKDLTLLKESTTDYIEYNQTGKGTSNPTAAKALANQDIREALNLATDRKTIVATSTAGSTVATGFVPTGMAKTQTGQDFAAYAKQPYTYDPTKAKELWEKGLKEIGATSVSFTYESDNNSPTAKTQADFLQSSWEKTLPGLKLTEKLVPFQQRLKDSGSHNFDIVNTLWGGDYAEPSTFLGLFLPGGGENDGGVNNAAYIKAYTAATTTPDVNNDAARNKDYKDAEAALYDESSINPVYFRTTPALRNPKLQGLVFHGTGIEYDLKGVYLEK